MNEPNDLFILLQNVEKKFKSARSINDMNSALTYALLQLGITTFSFTYYSNYCNSMHKLKYDFSSANYKSWHQHYLDQHYEEIDSTLDVGYRATLPVYWNLAQQLKQAKTSKEHQMRLDSIEFGAVKGLSIPIHGPQEDFANLVVIQMHAETCLNNWEKLQYKLFVIAYYYYSYLQLHLLKKTLPKTTSSLSKRDIECLTLLSKQFSVKNIALKLHITERTVNYHFQRLNKKLGTKNKYQSLAKALQKGLIKS